jgi:putative ABC transport system permease protein
MRSYQQLKTIDPGFELRSLLTARISLPATRYETHEKRLAFEQQLLEKTKTVPGVISASATTRLPLNEFAMTTTFEVDGVQTPEGGFVANFRRIGPGYFQTLKTAVLEGREFTDHDLPGNMPVIVISREMAKRFWPAQSAIGKRIRRLSPSDRNWRTIVGVVEDLKDSSVTTAPGLTFYVPFTQASISSFYLVIRTAVNPAQIVSELRSKIQEIDKDIPLYQEATAEELFLDSLSRPRFGAYLLACFAVLGLVISLIGVYGIISYSTSQRTNEIGVRMAIGAKRRSVLTLILQQSLKLTVWGILFGGLMAIVVERALSSMWYGHTNFSIYFATTVVLTITALLSSLVPALRATRINPAAAIRYE